MKFITLLIFENGSLSRIIFDTLKPKFAEVFLYIYEYLIHSRLFNCTLSQEMKICNIVFNIFYKKNHINQKF